MYRNIEKLFGQPVCFGSGVQQNDVSNASTSADLSYLDFQDHALVVSRNLAIIDEN